MKPTLKQFKKIINAIQDMEKKEDKLTDILVYEGSTGWIDLAGDLVSETVKLLETSLDDKAETIQWWFWEFINREDSKYVYEDLDDELEVRYDLSKVESLYFYLIDEKDKTVHKTVKKSDETKVYNVVSFEDLKSIWEEMLGAD